MKGANRMDSRGEEEGQSGCALPVAKRVAKMAGKEQREVAKGVAKKSGKKHDSEVAGVCAQNIKEKGANNRAADTKGRNKSVGGRGGGEGGKVAAPSQNKDEVGGGGGKVTLSSHNRGGGGAVNKKEASQRVPVVRKTDSHDEDPSWLGFVFDPASATLYAYVSSCCCICVLMLLYVSSCCCVCMHATI